MTIRTIHGDSPVYLATEGIIKALFANDERRLTGWVDKLITRHNEHLSIASHAFIYDGVIHRQSNVVGRIEGPKMLAIGLQPEMDALLRDKAIIDDDRAYIRQTLCALLEPCTHPYDVRDALPECLVSCVPSLSSYHRNREPAYTIQDNPRALRQYARILPKMEAYAAARLIF